MSKVRFREETKLRRSVVLGIVLLIILTSCFMYYTFFIMGSSIWVEVFLAILELAFIFMLLNFRKLIVTVTTDYLEFGYGVLKDRIKLSRITDCKLVEVKFQKYGGLGIKMEEDGSIAYVPKPGSCVKISIEGRLRDYIIYTRRPQTLRDLLLRKK